MIVLGKALFCNSFEVNHTKEVFSLILRFESPDGYKETVYVTISPAGATFLKEALDKGLTEYVEKFGKIVMDSWIKDADNANCNSNDKDNSSVYCT